jgi:Zn-dependent M16 (insulinase) family peptidase
MQVDRYSSSPQIIPDFLIADDSYPPKFTDAESKENYCRSLYNGIFSERARLKRFITDNGSASEGIIQNIKQLLIDLKRDCRQYIAEYGEYAVGGPKFIERSVLDDIEREIDQQQASQILDQLKSNADYWRAQFQQQLPQLDFDTTLKMLEDFVANVSEQAGAVIGGLLTVLSLLIFGPDALTN